MSAKQPTDYERAYHLARKLAYKRLKKINELKSSLERIAMYEIPNESGLFYITIRGMQSVAVQELKKSK